MTVELFMSLCVHHVENNLKPKGYGAGGKASVLIFDGHASRWSYAGLMYLMANNCWPFCLASHTSSWAQVGVRGVMVGCLNFYYCLRIRTHYSCIVLYCRWETARSTQCCGPRSRRRSRIGGRSLARTLRLRAMILTSALLQRLHEYRFAFYTLFNHSHAQHTVTNTHTQIMSTHT